MLRAMTRAGILAFVLFACVGCGELRGATELVDPGSFFDSGTAPRDGSTTSEPTDAPTGYALVGDYDLDPIPETHTILRLDRKLDPEHPQIVFVSSDGHAPIGCTEFAREGWQARLPAGAIVHVVELGGRTPGTFTATKSSPPEPGSAAIGRTVQNDPPLPLDYAEEGQVVIGSYDLDVTTGTFEAHFDWYVDDEQTVEIVRGSFTAPRCEVDW